METDKFNHVGERIKYIRKLNSKTQIQFSEILSISQASLSEIESGKSKPMFDTLKKIGSTFLIDMNWLLNNTDLDKKKALNNKEIQLVNKFRQLEEISQDEMLEYIEFKLKR
ncbi:MAG: helix-turn-helix transcriptional regulator [Paenibacillaceae bacterium]